MRTIVKLALFGIGLMLAGVTGAQAQYAYYPTPYVPNYPVYNYGYAYPAYTNYYGWPYPYYAVPPSATPKSYSDPYVWFRPYSDNAGPKAN